jgi:hypothetical protein
VAVNIYPGPPHIAVCITAPVLNSLRIEALIDPFIQDPAHGYPRRRLLGSS